MPLRFTRSALPLSAFIALVASPGCDFPPVNDREPPAVWETFDSIGDAIVRARPGDESARAQAAIDFTCPLAQLTAAVVVEEPDVKGAKQPVLVRIEGCGRGGVYFAILALGTAGKTTAAIGRPSALRLLEIRRFVDVSSDDAPAAVATLDRQAATLPFDQPQHVGWLYVGVVRRYVELGKVAATDLSCARETLALEVVTHNRAPNVYLVEGCGFRATYVESATGALVISARVALAPPTAK